MKTILAFFALSVCGFGIERPSVEYKIFQFPADRIPRIDGDPSDWSLVPESYSIGMDQLKETNKGRGFGYDKKSRPDLSNTSFLLDALQAAGDEANDEAVQRALVFVSRCQNLATEYNTTPFAGKNPDGGFYYTPSDGGQFRVQLRVWQDTLSLWTWAIAVDPSNAHAYYNRGVERQTTGDPDGSIADYDAALRLDPDSYTSVWRNVLAELHFNRGNALSVTVANVAPTVTIDQAAGQV
jgi:tetratricopeptide (TPR) repeat protein